MKSLQEMVLRRHAAKKRLLPALAAVALHACKQFLVAPQCATWRVRWQVLYLCVWFEEDVMRLYMKKPVMLEAITRALVASWGEAMMHPIKDIRFIPQSTEIATSKQGV
jgi:hypothetical protein